MKTLVQKVEDVLSALGKSPEDIRWIGNTETFTDWEGFKKSAQGILFTDNLEDVERIINPEELPDELKIVGDVWWLELKEMNGFGKGVFVFEYFAVPERPKSFHEKLESLKGFIKTDFGIENDALIESKLELRSTISFILGTKDELDPDAIDGIDGDL